MESTIGSRFSVSNATELSAAINAAQGGDIIELAAGNYGELLMNSAKFSGEGLTIASQDPDNLAVFDKVGLYRSENIHFARIEIDFEPVGNVGYKVGFRAAEGKDISITNSVLHGGFDPNRSPEYAESPVGLGVQIQRVDNVVIENNEIYDFHAGVSVAYVDDLQVNYNHIYDMRTSPLAGGGVSNVEVIGNHFESSHPVNLGGTGDHGDMIHFYPLTNQIGVMENIIIRDNFMEQGTNPTPILGVYIDDAGSGGSGLGYRNVVIENNIIHNGDAQGIRVENVDGLSIVDNSLIQSSGGGLGSAPGIVLTSNTQNVVIDNNIIAGLISGSSLNNKAELNVEIGDNLFIQDRDPFAEHYAGDLFVNGLTPNGDISDFTPLDGSAAEGYGATLVQFDPDNPAHIALVSDTRGGHLDLKTITFDLEALYDKNDGVDLTGADIMWDFGDSTTARGDNIAHSYDSAGSYDVTATVTLANGETVTVDHTTDVFTPEAVEMDFEAGFVDVSDIENRVTTVGDVGIEQGRFGDALRLVDNTSRVEIRRSEEILDNPEFSISFAFQKDGGTATNSDNGMFSYFSGTSYISTGEGAINFSGSTSTGRRITLGTEDEGIEDGAWHHVTYTFSAETRSAVLYLDGEEVDRMDNLTGIQHTTNGHDLLLGGRTGGAFGGLMDEFEFTRAALTAEEVSARYETLFDLAPQPTVPPVTEHQQPETLPEPELAPEPEPQPEPTPEPAPEPAPEPVEPDLPVNSEVPIVPVPDAIHAAGHVYGTSGDDTFVIGATRADVRGRGGEDTFIFEELSDTTRHHVRDFREGETLDVSRLFDDVDGPASDYIRLINPRWGEHTILQVNTDGKGFKDLTLLSNVEISNLDDAVANGTIQFLPESAPAAEIPEDAISAAGHAYGTSGDETFVIGATRADIRGRGGEDTFIFEELSDTTRHHVRDFREGETLDVSRLFDDVDGPASDYIRLINPRWGEHTILQVNTDGKGFKDLTLLSNVEISNLDDAVANGTIQFLPESAPAAEIPEDAISAAGHAYGTSGDETFVIGATRADIRGRGGEDTFIFEELSDTTRHHVRDFREGETLDVSRLFDDVDGPASDYIRLINPRWGEHTILQVNTDGKGFKDLTLLSNVEISNLDDAVANGTIFFDEFSL